MKPIEKLLDSLIEFRNTRKEDKLQVDYRVRELISLFAADSLEKTSLTSYYQYRTNTNTRKYDKVVALG